MTEELNLKLIGSRACPYTCRVMLALYLKRVACEFIEEEGLSNKSDLLVESNPVYKKIPVLIHDGKPIAESLVILEYIDETWPADHPLMPTDPLDRAIARFWAKFIDDKIVPTTNKLYTAKEEEKEEIVEEIHEQMMFLENLLKEKGSFGTDEKLGYLAIVVYFTFYELVISKEITQVELFDIDKIPEFCQWMGFNMENFTLSSIPPLEQDHLAYIRARIEVAKSASE